MSLSSICPGKVVPNNMNSQGAKPSYSSDEKLVYEWCFYIGINHAYLEKLVKSYDTVGVTLLGTKLKDVFQRIVQKVNSKFIAVGVNSIPELFSPLQIGKLTQAKKRLNKKFDLHLNNQFGPLTHLHINSIKYFFQIEMSKYLDPRFTQERLILWGEVAGELPSRHIQCPDSNPDESFVLNLGKPKEIAKKLACGKPSLETLSL
ncbi:MAG: hypothetical protein VW397_08845 [Candidatus Margulisiibacteriota bacterium]